MDGWMYACNTRVDFDQKTETNRQENVSAVWVYVITN